MNLENIPFEVQKVWVYQSLNQPVGLELYKEIESIIKKYPQYFEWEHIYNSVPKEVHSKYSASDSFQTLARALDLKPTDYILRDDT